MDEKKLSQLLEMSAKNHSHLCPRQVLGVRIGLAGLEVLGFDLPPDKKRLLVISETDGCFVDGLMAATECSVGHRTLRIEDYGKVSATFVDVHNEKAVRIIPHPLVRQRAYDYAPQETRRYFAQLYAYQIMPDDELLEIQPVHLLTSVSAIIGSPGKRVNCTLCGEEILNQREVLMEGKPICRSCSGESYYAAVMPNLNCAYLELPQAGLALQYSISEKI